MVYEVETYRFLPPKAMLCKPCTVMLYKAHRQVKMCMVQVKDPRTDKGNDEKRKE